MSQATGAPSPGRCLAVLLAVSGGAVALLTRLLPDLLGLAAAGRSGALADTPFDQALVEAAQLMLAGCAIWWWAATAVVAVDATRGHTAGRRGVPDVIRRVVLVACGLALAGGFASPSQAEEVRPAPGHRHDRQLVDGLPLPERATTTMQVSRVFAGAAEDGRTPTRNLVVVHPGDSLWELARADLPAAADDAAVALRVREIYRANRAVIGADPDLIRPDQRLRMPRP